MRYLTLLPALLLAIFLAACGPQEEGGDTMDEGMQESEQAMDDTMDNAESTAEDAGDTGGGTWEAAGEEAGEAWEETTEAAGEAWEATKETAGEAWDATSSAIQGNMSPGEKAKFDRCVQDLVEQEGTTRKQAERGCWNQMREEIMDEDATATDEEGAGMEEGDGEQ